jgi:hypothetical protein
MQAPTAAEIWWRPAEMRDTGGTVIGGTRTTGNPGSLGSPGIVGVGGAAGVLLGANGINELM